MGTKSRRVFTIDSAAVLYPVLPWYALLPMAALALPVTSQMNARRISTDIMLMVRREDPPEVDDIHHELERRPCRFVFGG